MKLNRSHSLTAQHTNNKVSFHFMSFIYLFIYFDNNHSAQKEWAEAKELISAHPQNVTQEKFSFHNSTKEHSAKATKKYIHFSI